MVLALWGGPVKPQNVAVLRLLRERPNGITALDALGEVATFRLAGRIHELRGEGFAIDAVLETTTSGKRISRYTLRERDEQMVLL